MVCPSESLRSGLDVELVESFRRGVELPKDCCIDVTEDRLWVLFPESDFLIQSRPADDFDSTLLDFTVTVRAPAPALETWWDQWSVTVDQRDLVDGTRREILSGRQMILRMLEERFGAR